MTYPPGNSQQNPYGDPAPRRYPAPGQPPYPQGPPPQSYASQGYPARGYSPHQQYGAPLSSPGGIVMLDCSYNKLGFFLAFTGPHIRVDGYGQDGGWGHTPISLPPGTHSIEVHTRYMGQMGPANLIVDVYTGQQVAVFYRAPAAIFFRGAMGHQPQPTPGMWLTWVLFVVAALILASTFLW